MVGVGMRRKSCISGAGCPEQTSNCPQQRLLGEGGISGREGRAAPHLESLALSAVIQLIVEINGLARGRGQEKTWGMESPEG